MSEKKTLNDMSVEELKILAFDTDMEGKRLNQQYTTILAVISQKLQVLNQRPLNKDLDKKEEK